MDPKLKPTNLKEIPEHKNLIQMADPCLDPPFGGSSCLFLEHYGPLLGSGLQQERKKRCPGQTGLVPRSAPWCWAAGLATPFLRVAGQTGLRSLRARLVWLRRHKLRIKHLFNRSLFVLSTLISSMLGVPAARLAKVTFRPVGCEAPHRLEGKLAPPGPPGPPNSTKLQSFFEIF